MVCSKVLSSIIILLLILLISIPLQAGVPTDQIRATVKKINSILSDPQFTSEGKRDLQHQLLRRVIEPRFDFTEMAKRSLGPHWRRRTPNERRKFIRLFTDLLEYVYIGKIEDVNNKTFEFLKEKREGNYAIVKTRVTNSSGESFSINYKAHLVNGSWKVYDIVAENISVLNNYRSQFNRTIRKSSYETLINKLEEKQVQLKKNAKQ